jgi:type I restriction enzyme, S subunit
MPLRLIPAFHQTKHNKQNRGIPHLRPMNINEYGQIDLSVVKYVQPESTYDTLSPGDILFNNTNSSALVGKTAQIKVNVEQAYSNHMTRIRLNTSANTCTISLT